jgi:hypothetical protein
MRTAMVMVAEREIPAKQWINTGARPAFSTLASEQQREHHHNARILITSQAGLHTHQQSPPPCQNSAGCAR